MKENKLNPKILERRKLIFKAIEDYYGMFITPEAFEKLVKALRSNSSIHLSKEEKRDFWRIQTNLSDDIYRNNLLGKPPVKDEEIDVAL